MGAGTVGGAVGIVDTDIARVREATDAVAVIGEQVALRRVGGRLVGLCPFHAERTPSFSVNAVEGLWYCFGCQARGDVIAFVRETQHLDFVGAMEHLAGRAGVTLHYDTPHATRQHQRRGALTDAMGAAVEWYHQRLLTAPDAGAARRYLRHERGYDIDVVRAFRLGWAPQGWDELSRALPFPAAVLREAGLAFNNKAGRQNDAFRGRVVFPIFDAGGHPVALGARVLPGGEGPKYKNSQEGPLYSKRRILYGLNWAKAEVVTKGEVIVCEGYTDVIAFHRAGVPRAVATCGTALADEHMALLRGFARRIVLAYDADDAGRGAAERFYEWEQRLDLEIRVLSLAAGTDPGEMGSTDPEGLRSAVQAARPFLAFRVERILDAADSSTAEGRARGVDQALEAIAAHPNELVRDSYVMQLADWSRASPDQLRRRLEEVRRRPRQARGGSSAARASNGRPGPRSAGDPRRAGRPGRAVLAAGPGPVGVSSVSGAAGLHGRPGSVDVAGGADRPPGAVDEPPLTDDGRYAPDDWDDVARTPRRTGPGTALGHGAATGDDGPGAAAGDDPAGSPPPREHARRDPAARAAAARRPGFSAEVETLRQAVHRPETVAWLLEEVLFDDDVHLAAFRALISADTLQGAIDGADPDVSLLLHQLAVEAPDPAIDPDELLANLVRWAARRAVAAIEIESRATRTGGDLTWPTQRIEALADAERRVEAAKELVAWLSGGDDAPASGWGEPEWRD